MCKRFTGEGSRRIKESATHARCLVVYGLTNAALLILLSNSGYATKEESQNRPTPDASQSKTNANPPAGHTTKGTAPAEKKEKNNEKGKNRLELEESVVVDGQRPTPGALFIDSKDERMRRAMEGLLKEAADGRGLSTRVSRPPVIKDAPYRMLSLSIQGMNQEETRQNLRRHLVTMVSCLKDKKRHARLEATLKINEQGRVRHVKGLNVTPADQTLLACAQTRMRAFHFPAPAAGSGRIQLTVQLGSPGTNDRAPKPTHINSRKPSVNNGKP